MNKKYGKVAVLMGGNTPEREISLISGRAILESLQKSGIDAYAFDPAEKPLQHLQSDGYARAFVIIHGKGGEDGKLQGALEYLGIPYTGSGVMASSIGMDKHRTKLIWQSIGIPMAKSQYLEKTGYKQGDFKLQVKLPVVVKPVDDGSTLGLSKVYDENQLYQAIDFAFQNSERVLIEEMIVGDEYTITVFDRKVYPVVKIEAPEGEYDYQNKYFTDDTKYTCPYDLGALQQKINDWALAGYNAIGASGVARLDFMVDKENNVYFLEINTLPGMTNHSLVPMSLAAAGYSFDQLCLMILDGASIAK
jgi:D-alanine-D-alanine ligase